MKVRAVLEFDLEDEDGSANERREEYVWAAEAAHDAICARLMGDGFLADDTLVGTYTLNAIVVDGAMGDPDPADIMMSHGGLRGEHPDYPVAAWHQEVARGETRSGYWCWTATKLGATKKASLGPPAHP